MKKIVTIPFLIVFLFLSCKNSNQESIKIVADEMCAIMEVYDEKNPLSIIDVENALKELAENTEEYKNINQSQLEDAMKTICPEGFRKFVNIMSTKK